MTVNAGVDLHKTRFTVCMPKNGKQVFERYPATDTGYADFLRNVKRRQGAGKRVRAGVEPTGNTRYFKSVMDGAGVGVHVINTLKFKAVNEPVKRRTGTARRPSRSFRKKICCPKRGCVRRRAGSCGGC
jgi:hypothetical protein